MCFIDNASIGRHLLSSNRKNKLVAAKVKETHWRKINGYGLPEIWKSGNFGCCETRRCSFEIFANKFTNDLWLLYKLKTDLRVFGYNFHLFQCKFSIKLLNIL